MWPVDPLLRTCTELPLAEGYAPDRPSLGPDSVITVRQLADIPVFVLLGEPGMGKSETMIALATFVLGAGGKPIAANDFIFLPRSQQDAERPVFIDALDEARASGGSTVWNQLRQSIVHNKLTRFGVSCRVADWQGTDAQDLATVAQDQRIRVFALNPLTTEQRLAVLEHEGIDDVANFEKQAQALGFNDMLGNPQSIKLLVASVKKNGYQWPKTRREAYEFACLALVKETNQRHRQAQHSAALLSDEALLDAAGWLCALMLLSNQNEVADETVDTDAHESVRLAEVLDFLPAIGFSPEAILQVLQRRLFTKPRGYAATHRTVAEYLAARHIAKRIAHGGLLANRVAALMLASSQHLVSNLRGLAGWLAVLCEPLQQLFFEADPWAVLDYGDLHLLSAAQKQTLIACLVAVPDIHETQSRWQRAGSYLPLIDREMIPFVSDWLALQAARGTSSREAFQVADVLLDAIEVAPRNPVWEPLLTALVRSSSLSEGLRASGLSALCRQVKTPEPLLQLLDELHSSRGSAAHQRLIDGLLANLYPNNLPPSRVLTYIGSTLRVGNRISSAWFWSYRIQRQTPDSRLPELMNALEVRIGDINAEERRVELQTYELGGLKTLTVRAICLLGAGASTETLSKWLRWCTDHEAHVFEQLSSSDSDLLQEWFRSHPEIVKAVLAHQVASGMSSWTAQFNIPGNSQPAELGRFWLEQAVLWNDLDDEAKASDCLATAFGWVDKKNGGVTLQDLEEAVAIRPALKAVLESHLSSRLDEKNWRRQHWLDDAQYRAQNRERLQLQERNLRYLLEHLDEVRSGKLLSYLSDAAWHDMRDSGYGGGESGELLAKWREQHPELDDATNEGYTSLLYSLKATQTRQVIKAHHTGHILHLELPCVLAANRLYASEPEAFFDLGSDRLEALVTISLFSSGGAPSWLKELAVRQTDQLIAIWQPLCASALRAKGQIRIPQLGWLRHETAFKVIAQALLPQILSDWPSKFGEPSFAEFAQVLEACLFECPANTVSATIEKRLKRKSLGSLQTAYLVMAGVWVDPTVYAFQLEKLLQKKQLIHSELLGFIGHLDRYGSLRGELPSWNADTMGLLFRLFSPLCPAAYPNESFWVGDKDRGRSFLFALLSSMREDPSEDAEKALDQLLQAPSTQGWHRELKEALIRQKQNRAEISFSIPTARQVALSLINRTPANPADLMAVAIDALTTIQRRVRNSDTNLINRFWAVNSAGKTPQPPHRPEPECRNVIADDLRAMLNPMDVLIQIEQQYGAQNQSDIALLVRTPGHGELHLPIEIKGDWNQRLWSAASQQLAEKYASDPRCCSQGLYLVLWMGELSNVKQHPNLKVNSPAELQQALQRQEDQLGGTYRIRVFVLDLSL